MAMRGLVQRLRWRSRLNKLAAAIADRIFNCLGDQLRDRVGGMNTAEMRGYVRARAAAEIRREVAAVTRRCGLPTTWQPRLRQLVNEALLGYTTDALAATRRTTTPLRRAA
jgi:hypothetical protein